MAKGKDDIVRVTLWTPPGMASWPYIAKPDVGNTRYSDNKCKTDHFIKKETFKLKGKALEDAVKTVGKAFFGEDYKITNPKWRSPFKDTDKDETIQYDNQKGCIMIRAKTSGGGTTGKPAKLPDVIAARKDSSGSFPKLSKDEIAEIKGGDTVALNITVYPYAASKEKDTKDEKGRTVPGKVIPGGISFGLNMVQFIKAGEGFGQGNARAMETAEEYEDSDSPDEVTADEIDVVDEEDNDSVI